MKVLVSPVSLEEARAVAAAGGTDIVDLKNPQEGSLGPSFPWIIGAVEIAAFVGAAHAAGLQVALAGSLRRARLVALRRLAPDVVGIRGAVCPGRNRAAAIDAGPVKAFVAQARMPAAA
jgi:uncharacterized protein (UPF0264 family)